MGICTNYLGRSITLASHGPSVLTTVNGTPHSSLPAIHMSGAWLESMLLSQDCDAAELGKWTYSSWHWVGLLFRQEARMQRAPEGMSR